jgi:pSer/pThr/pTyr-binding forkhead associated (FHA) protein
MSERSISNKPLERRLPADRVSRVLIGTVDDQLLRFPLFKDRLTIGRTKDNDIQLKAEYVSRRHAVIQTEGETTRIIDSGSKNGIHVNSVKTLDHSLRHGDIVAIGNARFRYEERKKRD